VVGTVLILVLSTFIPAVESEAGNLLTLPCTIETYGNAWNGALVFPLSTPLNNNYLVIMSTDGTILDQRESNGYDAVYDIGNNNILFQGEPYLDQSPTSPTYATHIWNLDTNATENFQNVISHHDIQYDPINNTFLTLQSYVRTVGVNSVLCDKMVQVDAAGNVLWSWDTYNYIPLSEASPFNETTTFEGQRWRISPTQTLCTGTTATA